MIKESIQLFGFLVLAFLGVVAPFLLILLSISREGTKELILQYENEKKQNEDNLSQLAGRKEDINIDAIKKSIKFLELNKENVQKKISSLDIKKQTLRLFIPLIISFSLVILSLIFSNILELLITFISLAVIILFYSLVMLWKTLCNIVEVRKLIDDNQRDYKNKTIELLTELKENRKTESNYLKNVTFSLNNKKLELDKKNIFNLSLNERNNLNFLFNNNEKIMIKNFEMGVILPPEFIIDNKSHFNNYFSALKESQLIRFFYQLVQAQTNIEWKELIITPIMMGNFKSTVYIKAENIIPTYFYIEFIVMKSNYENTKIKLLSAIYGTNEHYFDVYDKINSMINENGLRVTSSNDIAGDPHKGVRKKLVIRYISYGEEHEVEVPENETRTLP